MSEFRYEEVREVSLFGRKDGGVGFDLVVKAGYDDDVMEEVGQAFSTGGIAICEKDNVFEKDKFIVCED